MELERNLMDELAEYVIAGSLHVILASVAAAFAAGAYWLWTLVLG